MMFNPAGILRLWLAPPLRLRIRPRYFAPVALDSPHQALHDDVLRLFDYSGAFLHIVDRSRMRDPECRNPKPNAESECRNLAPLCLCPFVPLLMSVQVTNGSLAVS